MTETHEERRERLRQEADRAFPEAWRPEQPGDDIAGVIQHIEMRPTRFGPVPVVTVVDGVGTPVAIWCLHTVLRNELHRLAVTPGEFLYVRWLGKKTPEGGSAYDDYRVKVDRPQSRFDWALAGPLPDDTLPAPLPTDADMPASASGDDIPF